MGMCLFCCTHGGERITSHDVVQYVFVAIVKIVGFHVSQEQTHVLFIPCPSFFVPWVDIVLLIDGVYTLAAIIITNRIRVDFISQITHSRGVATSYKSSKGWFLLWSIPSRHVFPFSVGGIQMSKPVARRVSSSMCEHGVGRKGH
jgi:hypothetical protein